MTGQSRGGEVLTITTVNATSWRGAQDRGALGLRSDVLMLQETRLESGTLRAARAAATRAHYTGVWTEAHRLSRLGAASGGLATLTLGGRPWRKAAIGPDSHHQREGRWSHVVVAAGGTAVHVFNVYGWPDGTQDREPRQAALWGELFPAIAQLGGAPWVAAGDWNARPEDLWPHVLDPRVGGLLAGPATRQETCFPCRGQPKEYDFFLVSRSLGNCVLRYEYGELGLFPVHRHVTLSLRLAGLMEPVPTLRKPRAIPRDFPENGGGPGEQRPWTPLARPATAQAGWDAWTRAAEEWLLEQACVPSEHRGPYRGRGEPVRIQRRRPNPRTCHFAEGEQNGRARAWAVRADRYRDLARAREEGRHYAAGYLVQAIVADPPRYATGEWQDRDRRVAQGIARPEELRQWAAWAHELSKQAGAKVARARREAWAAWARGMWSTSPGKLYAWCSGERGPAIAATTGPDGTWLMQPGSVVAEAARQWGELWAPPDQEGGQPQSLPFGELPGMPPLTGALLRDIICHVPAGKAAGLDAWSVTDLRALPEAAFDDLAEVLHRIEEEGSWPRGLTGAVVALLPKKGDHAPLAQRPISLLPMIYRLWAAARGALLKEWFRENGHGSAWGQGQGRGADTAAWTGAVQAELATVEGRASCGAYIDCEKCYDHVSLAGLSFEGCLHGVGRLVKLAAAQYRGKRFVRWAGAIAPGVSPTAGIPAGCPLANGLLHLYLLRAMRETQLGAAPATLRTYVDDWRLFVAGAQKQAARDIVRGLREAMRQLEGCGMVVSTSKTVLLASGPETRQRLRLAAGEFRDMVALRVKDLGVDDSLGANHRRAAQAARVEEATRSARRIARLPLGWRGRATMALTLSKAQFSWGLDVTGLTGGTLRRLRRWLVFAVTGGVVARRAPEALLALAAPDAYLEPRLHLAFSVIRGWAKKCALDPGLPGFVLPAWRRELAEPSRQGRHRGPISLLVQQLRVIGWNPLEPARWLMPGGGEVDALHLEHTTAHLRNRLCVLRWEGLGERRADFRGAGAGVNEEETFRVPRGALGAGDQAAFGRYACIVSGGTWTATRRQSAGYGGDGMCRVCHGVRETPMHRWWDCPRWDVARPPGAPRLRRLWLASRGEPRCLWECGVLPAAASQEGPPPPT